MHLRSLTLLFSFVLLPLRGEDGPSISPALDGSSRKSGLPAAAESVTIPMKLADEGYYSVEAQIDGKTVQLVVDTGSTITILSAEVARKLGLKAIEGNEKIESSSGGLVAAGRALTKRISLGDTWTENEPVYICEMPPGVEGVLGVSTLADWDVRIDLSTTKLTLFPAGKAPSLESETTLPLTCEGQAAKPEAGTSNVQGFRAMNLKVPVRVGNHEVPATPDTGFVGICMFSSVLMEKAAPEAMKGADPAKVNGTSISGQAVTRHVMLPKFTFGPDTLCDLPAEVMDVPPGSGSESGGILGLSLLRHYVMTFRFAAGELRLKPLGTVEEVEPAPPIGVTLGGDFRIVAVEPDGPGAKAGLRVGDEILEIEGHPLKTMGPEGFSAISKHMSSSSALKVRYRRGESAPEETQLLLVK